MPRVPATKKTKQSITSFIGAHYSTLIENYSEQTSNNPETGQQASKQELITKHLKSFLTFTKSINFGEL
jgi:hypothetical protein